MKEFRVPSFWFRVNPKLKSRIPKPILSEVIQCP